MMRRALVATWGLLTIAVSACGDDDAAGRLPDAGPTLDAAIDTPTAPMPVTVTVTLGGVPSKDQVVYFQSRDSATVSTQMTDADGNARAVVEAGGFVTVIEPTRPAQGIAPFTGLSTFAGVQPGDHLYVNVSIDRAPPASKNATITVKMPNEQLGYTYQLQSTCGGGEIGRGNAPARGRGATSRAVAVEPVSNTITLTDCNGKADLLVVGSDSDHIIHSWAYKADVAIADGTVVEFTAYQAPVQRTLSYALVNATSISASRTLATARGVLWTEQPAVSVEQLAGTVTFDTVAPPGVKAIFESQFGPQPFSQQRVIEWGADADYTLDMTKSGLHEFTNAASVDIAKHALVWTENTVGVAPEWTTGSYFNARTDAGNRYDWRWRIAGP